MRLRGALIAAGLAGAYVAACGMLTGVEDVGYAIDGGGGAEAGRPDGELDGASDVASGADASLPPTDASLPPTDAEGDRDAAADVVQDQATGLDNGAVCKSSSRCASQVCCVAFVDNPPGGGGSAFVGTCATACGTGEAPACFDDRVCPPSTTCTPLQSCHGATPVTACGPVTCP
jgi:hypothetical protein